MSRAVASRDAWHPQSSLDRDAILLELREVLASSHFCNSKRYPALLQYIVEKTLSGDSDSLKERTLGVEVFDRPPSYDTNADTVVRYTAGEVRKRLSLYYHELDHRPTIQISLPAGSYVPEFLHPRDDDAHGYRTAEQRTQRHEPESSAAALQPNPHPESTPPSLLTSAELGDESHSRRDPLFRRRAPLALFLAPLTFVLLSAVVAISLLAWQSRKAGPDKLLNSFWAPVLHDQSTVLICTGGSVFAQNNFSGVLTAGKDIDYPFISIQTASAIARLSGLAQRSGSSTQLQSAASTPLTELRDRPIILLGGYNNQWTIRMLQPLRFHFSPETPIPSIVDTTQAGFQWNRDRSLPYSSADDYALVVRFHNTVTDSWVVALAGLGRNGTEAAAQFVTSPRYMQQLRDRLGSDFANRNIEVVLKVNVIDGKTGAPTILAVHTW